MAERGREYYYQDKVLFISVKNGCVKAIVEGTENYLVEFNYNNGKVSNLLCSCPYVANCKHEFAVLLQLKDCLKNIDKNYKSLFNGEFSAITRSAFNYFVLNNIDFGKISL